MEIWNKLTVTKGGRGIAGWGKKGQGCQGTYKKGPWTKTMVGGGLNVGG